MNLKYALLTVFLVVVSITSHGQDKRTVQTQVADALALLPAKSSVDADRLYKDLIGLSDEGLTLVMNRVLPNGQEEGVPARFAVSLLTHHSGAREEKVRIENAYLRALSNASDLEVRSYFIDNIKVVGTNASVPTLAALVKDEGLAQQAISALTSIGTSEAGNALQTALSQNSNAKATARLIQALGELKYDAAVQLIGKHATDSDTELRKHALWALALIADAGSYPVLLQQAKNAKFRNDPAQATHALVRYIHELSENGNSRLAVQASQEILSNALDADQQHFRLAALHSVASHQPADATKILIKELNRFDPAYQREVLKIASGGMKDKAIAKQWLKVYKKSSTLQSDILSMLAQADRTDAFAEQILLPALKSRNASVRMTAAEEIAYSDNKKFQASILDYLLRSTTDDEIEAAKNALLRMMEDGDLSPLRSKVATASPANRAALIQILAERRASEHFDIVFENILSNDEQVTKAAYSALPYLATPRNTSDLLGLLSQAQKPEYTILAQKALIASLDKSSQHLIYEAYPDNKARILPVLPYVDDSNAFAKVKEAFESGNAEEKAAAFQAMLDWQNHDATRTLLAIRRDPELKGYHDKAFQAFVSQVGKSSWPDDQKLLMLSEAMREAKSNDEKTAVIRSVGNVRTFLALVFASQYLDDKELNRAASRSVMQIALPTADAKPGLTGSIVRNTLQRILDKLEGQDSQYEVIDIQTYLANMPYTQGFQPIFNGKDLTGWQGLVENPIARAKMTQAELAKKQKEADEKLKESWSVKDGAIYFTGHGSNLCTTRPYGDFEMYVDWKISRDGDSGIYLRGSPQVQIWDPTGKSANAKVGSGGLFNNKENPSKPLVVADNPVGEWNTFYIKMIGERVTVHLNGVLVADNVVMENYWDRNLPIFPQEAIELQAHGNELAFRNIYVKELKSQPYELTAEEKEEGFELLFNGRDLDNWVGNKTDYVVEDNAIAIYPAGKGHGNLYTEKEYSDFVFRFEFQLTPGANNGLGIHAPLTGDAAYGGKEIQILDDTAPVYAKLEPYQYHGSVYGIVPAKRGHLKPVGEWNDQEVIVRGNHIKVILNGAVIVDADLKKASLKGTIDKRDHPGLSVNRGHIGFLGHGTIVRFKNIRVKDLSNKM